MAEPDLRPALTLSRRLAWLAGRMEGALLREHSGFLLVDSGIPSDTFNKIVSTSPGLAEADARAAIDHFRASAAPFAWTVAEDRTAGVLEAAGLRHTETEETMGIDLSDLRPAPEVPGLQMARIGSVRDLDAWASIQALNWNPPDPLVGSFYRRAATAILSEGSPFAMWLAMEGGEPVAALEVFLHEGEAGIYNVSTKAAHRGRGIASTLMTAALAEARRRGAVLSTLSATAAGAGVYRRLGYRGTGELREYAP